MLILSLYKTYIQDQELIKYLPVYKLSQDHLELLFNSIRRAGGWNNNPSAKQFGLVFRRILFRCGVSPSITGNVLPQDGTALLTGIEPTRIRPQLLDNDCRISFIDNAITYIGGWVVRKLMEDLDCNECKQQLTEPAKAVDNSYHLIQIRDNGGLFIHHSQ